MQDIIQLPTTKSGKVTHVIHLADIHIRIGDPVKSRYNEYAQVFNNLFQELKLLSPIKNHSTVIVVAGDFFETKNRIESPGIKLFEYVIQGLTDLAPTYIIQGNHDYRQDQPESPDMLSSLLHGNQNSNLAYLDRTGCYIVENIGISVVSVKDTLKEGMTSGQVENLPPFPDNFPTNINTKIALFHGTIIKSTMQNYTKATAGYPIEWIHKHDIGLLGDVHLQQIHGADREEMGNLKFSNDKLVWGYPGSLVQQNFGEPIFGHGYLLWDIENKKVSQHHIKNEYGFLYIGKYRDEWCGKDRDWIKLENLFQNPNLPSQLIVKIKGRSVHEDNNELHSIRNKFPCIDMHFRKSLFDGDINIDDNEEIDPQRMTECAIAGMSNYNSPDTWIQYIEENHTKCMLENIDWKFWLKNPETLAI